MAGAPTRPPPSVVELSLASDAAQFAAMVILALVTSVSAAALLWSTRAVWGCAAKQSARGGRGGRGGCSSSGAIAVTATRRVERCDLASIGAAQRHLASPGSPSEGAISPPGPDLPPRADDSTGAGGGTPTRSGTAAAYRAVRRESRLTNDEDEDDSPNRVSPAVTQRSPEPLGAARVALAKGRAARSWSVHVPRELELPRGQRIEGDDHQAVHE